MKISTATVSMNESKAAPGKLAVEEFTVDFLAGIILLFFGASFLFIAGILSAWMLARYYFLRTIIPEKKPSRLSVLLSGYLTLTVVLLPLIFVLILLIRYTMLTNAIRAMALFMVIPTGCLIIFGKRIITLFNYYSVISVLVFILAMFISPMNQVNKAPTGSIQLLPPLTNSGIIFVLIALLALLFTMKMQRFAWKSTEIASSVASLIGGAAVLIALFLSERSGITFLLQLGDLTTSHLHMLLALNMVVALFISVYSGLVAGMSDDFGRMKLFVINSGLSRDPYVVTMISLIVLTFSLLVISVLILKMQMIAISNFFSFNALFFIILTMGLLFSQFIFAHRKSENSGPKGMFLVIIGSIILSCCLLSFDAIAVTFSWILKNELLLFLCFCSLLCFLKYTGVEERLAEIQKDFLFPVTSNGNNKNIE